MNKAILKTLGALVLLVPSLLLAGNLHTKMKALEVAETVRLPMGGYDPVSLLHGRYVRITFDRAAILEGDSICTTATCCLCFNQNEEGAWKAKRTSCEATETQSCARVTNNTGLLMTAHEYYVDEREAPRLEKIMQKAQRDTWDQREAERLIKEGQAAPVIGPIPQFAMDVAILRTGEARFKMLYIDGMPFREYLQKNP